jgi:hypothetical protein
MNQKRLLLIVVLGILLPLLPEMLHAQALETLKTKHNATAPSWVKMMADPHANYFETVKAFREFWKDKPQPVEEDEKMDKEVAKRKWLFTRLFQSRSARMKEESEKYAFEYKRFIWWQRQTLPYVQPDGHILSPEERLAIWKEQQRIRNAQSAN